MARSAEQPPVIGIDVGGTNMQIGVVDGSNQLIGRDRRRTGAVHGLEHVIDTIEKGVGAACEDAGLAPKDVAAVGVVAAGAIDHVRGVVISAPNLRWTDVALRAILSDRLGLPVVVDNDVNGAIWGEFRLGAAADHDDALGIWVGTGIGAGLVFNGALYHGAFATAGEIGHTVITPHDPAGRRTVEDHCSRTGMRKIFIEKIEHFPDSLLHRLTDGDVRRLGTHAIEHAYAQDDPLTTLVVNEGAELLGISIANWVTALALPVVVLGGGITEALGDAYLERIRHSFETTVFPDRNRACVLAATTLTADAGVFGAALLARERSGSGA